ncbi:unnamed protein product, partial [Heterosigma akashiwo]
WTGGTCTGARWWWWRAARPCCCCPTRRATSPRLCTRTRTGPTGGSSSGTSCSARGRRSARRWSRATWRRPGPGPTPTRRPRPLPPPRRSEEGAAATTRAVLLYYGFSCGTALLCTRPGRLRRCCALGAAACPALASTTAAAAAQRLVLFTQRAPVGSNYTGCDI